MNELSSQLLGIIQPLVGRTGTLLTSMAASAASFLGWSLFVLLTSYFVLVESGDVRGALVPLDVPGYADDIRRLGQQLSRIWNASFAARLLFSARYLPTSSCGVPRCPLCWRSPSWRIGQVRPIRRPSFLTTPPRRLPADQPFGMTPLSYAILCVVVALLIDQVFDNFVTPRIISQALKLHPAAVLIAALVFANLLGLLGVVIAAPILATVALVWRYIMHKMLDLNPWPEGESLPPSPRAAHMLGSIRRWFRGRGKPRA
jgi:hypothetical protein